MLGLILTLTLALTLAPTSYRDAITWLVANIGSVKTKRDAMLYCTEMLRYGFIQSSKVRVRVSVRIRVWVRVRVSVH